MSEDQIHLSADARAHIQMQLGKGGYSTASDFIESLVREDQLTRAQLDAVLRDHNNELEQQAMEGLSSGEPMTADADYWAEKRRRITDELGS